MYEFAEVVNAQDLEKTLRIVITSGMVNHDRFVGALKESLVPACKKVNINGTADWLADLYIFCSNRSLTSSSKSRSRPMIGFAFRHGCMIALPRTAYSLPADQLSLQHILPDPSTVKVTLYVLLPGNVRTQMK